MTALAPARVVAPWWRRVVAWWQWARHRHEFRVYSDDDGICGRCISCGVEVGRVSRADLRRRSDWLLGA
jgi:hypothetical protein